MSLRVFLAGAHGAIGRRLVPQLLAAGHNVTGTTRSPSKAAELKALGLEAVVVDVFDAAALTAAAVVAAPDVIIHQLTDLPANPDPAQAAEFAARNARVRKIGTAHLVAAAQQAGVRRVIAQSIAWAYAPGDSVHVEADPLDLDADGTRAVTVGGVVALESQVLQSPPLSGVVLRYGALYGPGTGASHPKRGVPVAHVDAAARAAVLAMQTPASGLYNIAEAGSSVSVERARRELGWDLNFRLA